MRLQPGRNRRHGQNLWATPTLASVLVNILLAGLLIYVQLGRRDVRSAEDSAPGKTVSELQSLRKEIQNASASLERASVLLQEKDVQLAATETTCQQKADTVTKRSAALQLEAEKLRHQLSQLQASEAAQDVEDARLPSKLWLTIGIPTIPRKDNTDYLTRTLGSLFEELPLDATDLMYRRVKVIVMNNRPGQHIVWEQVRQRIFGKDVDGKDVFVEKGRLYTEFLENTGEVADPTPLAKDPDDAHNPSNRPGREVRRQTCDLIHLLEVAQPKSEYYVFMEDDFRVCPYMLRVLSYAVRKLNSIPEYGRWLGLRFSYGMNGILVRNEDLVSLTAYLRKHTARLPPDLLWTEWYTGRKPELRQLTRGRKLAVFRFNMLDHLGARSSFSVRIARPSWPRCYHPMSAIWSLARTEQFNAKRCWNSDLSPCPTSAAADLWLRYPIGWPNITEGSDLDHPQIPPEADSRPTPPASIALHESGRKSDHIAHQAVELNGDSKDAARDPLIA